ncbi:unnamed protein product, partial [Rotaria sp. Silwood2]
VEEDVNVVVMDAVVVDNVAVVDVDGVVDVVVPDAVVVDNVAVDGV